VRLLTYLISTRIDRISRPSSIIWYHQGLGNIRLSHLRVCSSSCSAVGSWPASGMLPRIFFFACGRCDTPFLAVLPSKLLRLDSSFSSILLTHSCGIYYSSTCTWPKCVSATLMAPRCSYGIATGKTDGPRRSTEFPFHAVDNAAWTSESLSI
jgi:hypothetical protein